MARRPLVIASVVVLAGAGWLSTKRVGPQTDGTTVVPTGQEVKPMGRLIQTDGRPIDLALSKDGGTLFVKDSRGLCVVDYASGKVITIVKFGTSLIGLALVEDGSVWVTASDSSIRRVALVDGVWKEDGRITLPAPEVKGAAYPCGIAIGKSGIAYAAASRSNKLVVADLSERKVLREFESDICPFDVAVSPDEKHAWVSCWGGERPEKDERTQPSSGTEVEVEANGVPSQATVVCLNLETGALEHRVDVGLMPTDVLLNKDGSKLFVANANDDTVSIIPTADPESGIRVDTRPDPAMLFGSGPNGLALSQDETRLYVSNGSLNSVAVFDLGSKSPKAIGSVPVGWYPTGLLLSGGKLIVANSKGTGSRAGRSQDKSFNSHGHTGNVSVLDEPRSVPKSWTEAAIRLAKIPEGIAAKQEGKSAKAAPVPAKVGEPSPIKNVVYIIKENRTYDQVFGDLKQGNGDASLCTFPRAVTPNIHALAEQFVLLDNFYCNGVLSADGHSWTDEGNVTAYFERSFGGWTRSYPFGDDPLAVSKTGFLWDHVLAAGLSFKNFGEFNDTSVPRGKNWKDVYDDFASGTRQIELTHKIEVARVKRYSHPEYPGWNMSVPDVLRADVFLKDFATWKTMPNLVVMYLPQDHTSGSAANNPKPEACVADNDLALGRVVEAISNSPFWKETAIFVVEDDPQAGWDHVDGHRSPCLVISPYVKHGSVVSEFYNQTSVLHTITRIFGIPPMNEFTAASPVMSACFTAKPNLEPYKCRPNSVALDDMNPKSGGESRFDLSVPDAINEDAFNREIWAATMPGKPYPAHLAGAHGGKRD